MSFTQAISSYFRNYANFKGRSRRSEYWYSYLLYIIVYLILYLVAGIGMAVDSNIGEISFYLYTLWILGNLIPILAAGVRRMHDIGKSGWFILIPIYNIVLLATETVPGTNQYGEPAK
jgi:uncharacterized membrane protein YhaH (DUF805 family)